MTDSRVETSVVVQSCLRSGKWLAALPNGKRILLFARKHQGAVSLKPGEQVRASLSLLDFNKAELVLTVSDAGPQARLQDEASASHTSNAATPSSAVTTVGCAPELMASMRC